MKVLITGISGMVGSHLAEYILTDHPDVDLHGVIRWRTPLDHLVAIKERITLHCADLRDLNSLIVVIKKVKPDWIFHLAAQSFVTTSFDAPVDTLSTNVIGTTNLLDALRITGVDAKVHVCSSSEVYGQVLANEVPISESNPFRPASPYAVSKVGEDMIAFQYFLSYGIRTVRTRMFTHTGPRRGDVFAESAYAKQIVEVEYGLRKNPIRVGNLDSIRTFADVRDAVRAYWVLMEQCPAGEVYNIGGARTMTLRDMLEILKGMATCRIEHVVDPALLRPSDVTLQIPDTSKFKKATGWEPRIPFEETLKNILDFYRTRYHKRSKAA
ncbi:MAG TPA: GDP-mannose 4,6-dehydratase [Nitrospirales bacterium]|nr:GDP-mannose 4,6-dehydratase [Nitrospiraceae bacterium]HNP27543.1 GDP-mannose 4,6-dehydratase [Nitrospirales bacterium]